MGVKVINGRVFDGKKTYEVGDVINKLTAEDETALVEAGTCEYVGKPKPVVPPVDNANEENQQENPDAINPGTV